MRYRYAIKSLIHKASLMVLGMLCLPTLVAANFQDKTVLELLDLSLEDLMNIEVVGSGTLTKTTRREVPATITTLTQEDIRRTGARSLDELLLITVPNLQKQFHRFEYEHLGVRGIISDREDKYLLLVNGRNMNERYFYGALAERDLPMLTDIHHIDVVRGPGSALYGPGAIGMVINIITETGLTYEGRELTTRSGAIEEFYSGEYKYGRRWDEDTGLFLYAGASKYPGADGQDAPRVYSQSVGGQVQTIYGESAGSNKEYPGGYPKLKFHGHLNHGGLEIWGRYSRGGHRRYSWLHPDARPGGDAYQKVTTYLSYDYEIYSDLTLTGSFSYDTHEHAEEYLQDDPSLWRRDDYTGRILANWTPHKNHQFVLGEEWSHARNNLRGFGWPGYDSRFNSSMGGSPFHTNLISTLGEYQVRICHEVTAFLGGRVDWHNYIHNIFSPRAAVTWMPTERDTLKLMFTKSARTNHDTMLREGYINNLADANEPLRDDVETIKTYELRYERQQTEQTWLAGGIFYNFHKPVAWAGSAAKVAPLGEMQSIGAEVEAIYQGKGKRLIFSHSYVNLCSYSADPCATWQIYTASQFGYGDDFAHWDDHVTKIRGELDLNDQWSVDGSVQLLWGSRGKKDWVVYRQNKPAADQHIYEGGYFLNLGIQYEPSEVLLLRVDGYNLLGFIDRDHNAIKSVSEDWLSEEYNILTPAVGVSAVCRF